MTPLQGFSPEGASHMGDLLGREIVLMEGGFSEARFTIGDVWLNMQGILHGGAYAAMLDTCCGMAIRSKLDLEKYRGHSTLELKTSYFKAGHPGVFIGKGQVLRMGRSIAYSDASLFNADGDEVGRASATFKLLQRD